MVGVGQEYQDTTPKVLDRHRDAVEKVLRQALSLDSPGVGTMLQYHLGWVDREGHPIASDPGKGLRSSLCLFACEAVGGRPEQAVPAAAAVELTHNFSLIHDDIQDGDRERRHRPTVWAVWGKPRALQAGNVMRTVADLTLQQLTQSQCSTEAVVLCSQLLTDACMEMIEGQYLDLDFEGRTDVNAAGYLDMISRKTGALIRCSMQLGAIVGGGHPRTTRAMARCGQRLGLAFQIRDDYLGIWGREEETGKAVGSDLRRKKNSLPLVYAMARAGAREREQLRSLFAKESVEDEDVAQMMALLEGLGAQEYAQRLAQEHGDWAVDALEGVELAQGAREDLCELVEFLVTRQR